MSYYYDNHKLNSYYCSFRGESFKTREEYLEYCLNNNIPLTPIFVNRKSKYSLEGEEYGPCKPIEINLALGTYVYDNRDLTSFYFKDEDDAKEFLKYYKNGSPRWAVECLFEGYEGEPDYSADAIVNRILARGIQTYDFNPEKEWKHIGHFIISYLPDDEKKKAKRKDAHWKQIQSIKAITPNAKIHIIAQNYKDGDYIEDPQIEYRSFGKLGVVGARNNALKWFYETNYDFGIINDDDVFMNPTQSAINFYQEIEDDPEKFYNFDVIYARDMYHMPLQLSELKHRKEWEEKWVFQWAGTSVLHWVTLRNFKKYYGIEEYQDPNLDSTKGQGYDDADFGYYLNSKGYKVWRNVNALQSYAQSWYLKDSSLYEECTVNPWIRLMNVKNDIKKWIGWDENGNINMEGFRLKTGHYANGMILPKKEKVDSLAEFTERNVDSLWELHNVIYQDPEYNI